MPRTRPPPMSSGPQFPSGSSLGPCKAPLSVPEALGCPTVLTGITACGPLCPSPSHTWEELRTSPPDGRLRRGFGEGWGGGVPAATFPPGGAERAAPEGQALRRVGVVAEAARSWTWREPSRRTLEGSRAWARVPGQEAPGRAGRSASSKPGVSPRPPTALRPALCPRR